MKSQYFFIYIFVFIHVELLQVCERDRNEGLGRRDWHKAAIIVPTWRHIQSLIILFSQGGGWFPPLSLSLWAIADSSQIFWTFQLTPLLTLPVFGYLCSYNIHDAYALLPFLLRALNPCVLCSNILFMEFSLIGCRRSICKTTIVTRFRIWYFLGNWCFSESK